MHKMVMAGIEWCAQTYRAQFFDRNPACMFIIDLCLGVQRAGGSGDNRNRGKPHHIYMRNGWLPAFPGDSFGSGATYFKP